MKKAKVSPMYEGRERKRGIEGEEEGENSSKSARMSAKARTNNLRARRAVSIISNDRTIITRSMSSKIVEEKGEEKVVEAEVQEEKKNMNDDDNTNGEEKKGDDDVGELTLDDWPLSWSYEEELSWFKQGYQCGWYSYWETMDGDFWRPVDDNQQAFWNDEPWPFNADDDITNP